MLKAFGCGQKLPTFFCGWDGTCIVDTFVVKSECFVVIFWVIVVIFEWLVVIGGVFVVKVTLGQRNW